MRPNYIFIVGVQKGGTTALAGWLVSNGLAAYAVPGVKEPSNYLRVGVHAPLPPPRGTIPLLDASTGYFANSQVTARLPEHRTRIAVCLRNPLERAWSAYRMMKLIAQQGAGIDQYLDRFHAAAGTSTSLDRAAWYQARRNFVTQGFRRASARMVEKHFDAEATRLAEGRFLQRLDYELAFYMSNRNYPFFSTLSCSFYHRGLRMLLDKYQPEDVAVLTVNSLSDAGRRARLVEQLTDHADAGSDIGVSFTLSDLELDEPTPDFTDSAFDHFRCLFAYDLERTQDLLARRGVATDLLDTRELQRHIIR